jgi:hypothetical protein
MVVTGASWENTEVPCTFAATADGVALAAIDPAQRVFDLPAGTAKVEITAKPTTTLFWPTTITLVVGPDGGLVLQPGTGTAAVGAVFGAMGTSSGLVMVVLKISRFRDKTADVTALINGTIPTPRKGAAPGAGELSGTYGTWPPGTLDIKPLPSADYLDIDNTVTINPATSARELNFAKDAALDVDVETVVLELAGVAAPRLFGVTWPKAVVREADASPTPFLLFLRQTGWQDGVKGVFDVKGQPYPFNFDYAERCLFESMHYPPTPLFYAIGWTLRPKGVPYQVAKSGARVVTVFPVAHTVDRIGYGELGTMDQTGKILEELQAFMFWQAGIAVPPTSVGKTAIATYSSANYVIVDWLMAKRNLTSTFLNDTVSAIYFLDPPDVDGSVSAGRSWVVRAGSDKRVRLYSRKKETNAFRLFLDMKKSDPALPPPPYVVTSADGTRSVASFPTASWVKLVKTPPGKALAWWDTHHFIPATVLTHALAQGDI